MIRDRKMYVVPTPFYLIEGSAHHQTLVLPADVQPGDDFFQVGELVRQEAAELIVGYSFGLRTNEIVPEGIPNPGAGREHAFKAWRLAGSPADPISLRPVDIAVMEQEAPDEDEEEA
jgi:hypothetical protein